MLIPYSGEVALIKLAGYTLAGFSLKKIYRSRFNYFLFGFLRFVTGAFVWLFLVLVLEGMVAGKPLVGDAIALFLSRLIVWIALIALVFQRRQAQNTFVSTRQFWFCVLAAIAWSYCLDGLVALLRLAIPGFGTMAWC